MASKPPAPATGPTPASGDQDSPVNQNFAGPNALGLFNDVPPQFGDGPTPLVVTNGVSTPRLGMGPGTSPKTHG